MRRNRSDCTVVQIIDRNCSYMLIFSALTLFISFQNFIEPTVNFCMFNSHHVSESVKFFTQ